MEEMNECLGAIMAKYLAGEASPEETAQLTAWIGEDRSHAREFARCYSAKLGAAAIRSKLMEKGISREVIDASVEFSREAEREAAAGLVAKLREKYAGVPEEKRRQRIYQALLRKGFSYGDAAELLRNGEDE